MQLHVHCDALGYCMLVSVSQMIKCGPQYVTIAFFSVSIWLKIVQVVALVQSVYIKYGCFATFVFLRIFAKI